MKYYHSVCANSNLRSMGFIFQFEPYELVGGAWKGIYATEDEPEIEALDAIINSGNRAITEITQEKYESCKKKATQQSRGYASLSQLPVEHPLKAVEAAANNVVLTPESIKVGQVVPSQPQTQPPIKRARKSFANDQTVAVVR